MFPLGCRAFLQRCISGHRTFVRTLLKMPFRKMKAFFFFKIICFFIIFSNFSNFNFFLIFAKKTSKIRWKGIFKKIPFETLSRKKFPHVAILKNFKIFFEKKFIYFSEKKPTFECFEVLRNLSIPIAFYGKFATIWWKSYFRFRREQNCRCWRERNWQTSGKKNVRNSAFERKILLPYFKYGAK